MTTNRLRGTWAAATDIAEDGLPITLRGLMRETELSSTSTASYHVDKLIRLGYLLWDFDATYGDRRATAGIRLLIPLGSYRESDIKRKGGKL